MEIKASEVGGALDRLGGVLLGIAWRGGGYLFSSAATRHGLWTYLSDADL